MKIAVVIPKYGLVGGAEEFAYEVTDRIAGQGDAEVHIFAHKWRQGASSIIFHKVPMISFPRSLRQVSFAYFANRLIRSENVDLIHSHDRIFNMDLFTMHGIPHETWVREVRHKSPGLFDRSMSWVEKKGLHGPPIPMVMPVSNLAKDELLRRYDIPASRVRVVHPGVTIERFSKSCREKYFHEIRQRHQLSVNDIIVLFVGMNFEIKGLELIMRGIGLLKNDHTAMSHVKLLVVGKGDEERYRRIANHLGIGDRVVFAGVTRGVEKYYLASDIFAMPSIYDTFGLTVLEAMAAGLPVMITKLVGACDVVDSGMNGFVLDANPEPSDFSEKIEVLMEKGVRMEMGENARKVAHKYTWENTASKVGNIYGECVREKKRNASFDTLRHQH